MKDSKPVTIGIFVGVLLVVIFGVGLTCEKNPAAFMKPYRDDFALEQFCNFCKGIWLPAGVIGIPLMLVCLIISFIREKKEN